MGVTAGILITSGCIGGQEESQETEDNQTEDGSSKETSGQTTDEPLYEIGAQGDLLLSVDAFPEGWEQIEMANSDDTTAEATFSNADGTLSVYMSASILDSVAGTKEAFERYKSRFREPQELETGDESFWDTREDQALTVFRHSNALGEVRAARITREGQEPNISRSQNYALDLYNHWQSVTQ